MPPRKLNVLVYAGNGSTTDSVRHCLYTLRRLLSPNYAVIPVTESVILKEPWAASCALLVFPGGADLSYCRSLNGEGNNRISQFVRRGGAYLGLCAGGYYGSARCEFEVGDKKMEVIGRRELAFFPGTCRGCAFKGFVYSSEAGARATDIKVEVGHLPSDGLPDSFKCYYNGGGLFVDASKYKNQGIEVLATYSEPVDVDAGNSEAGPAAVVFCKVGDGKVVLTGMHPEFAGINLNPQSGGPDFAKIVDDLINSDESRSKFFKSCLLKLGLMVSQEASPVPSLSHLHLSSVNPIEVSGLLEDLKDIITSEDGEEYIRGENDTFRIEKNHSQRTSYSLATSLGNMNFPSTEDSEADGFNGIPDRNIDYDKVVKTLIPHETDWPGSRETPYFNHQCFYSHLRKYQQGRGIEAGEFGKMLLYGEVVTSTNTILEKNYKLLAHLPEGLTATATTQVAGRGRGSNVWVSPPGSLIFSTCLTHPMTLSNTAPVVFVQYIAAIAVAESIKTYDKGYGDVPIKLKWPNDIYAEDPTKSGKKEYVKIGGILVNSSYSFGSYNLVVGIGINTTNPAPTTSLNAIIPSQLAPFTLEKLLARILTTFETLYRRFCRTGFDKKFQDTYYKHWLHTDQIVTLETEGGVRARILGITSNWGLLRVEELGWEDRPTGKIYELQSDSNSFDFFQGLLKAKK